MECVNIISDCGGLAAPADGFVTFDPVGATYEGTTATFTCGDDFFLDGESVSECDANGDWTNTPPVCKPGMLVKTVNFEFQF